MKEVPKWWIGIEDPCWYDGICCWQDEEWNSYSRVALIPLKENEMCKYGKIYEVEQIIDWPWTYNYHYKILSSREDKDGTKA